MAIGPVTQCEMHAPLARTEPNPAACDGRQWGANAKKPEKIGENRARVG